MSSSEIMEALKRCELFTNIDEGDIKQIADLCQIETYKAGDSVVSQGEFGTRIFLIAEGQVVLIRSVNLGERQASTTIDVLSNGRGLGWSSILCDPCGASASAVCQKPTKLIALPGAPFRAAMEAKPQLGFKIMDRLAQIIGNRLRAAYGAMDTLR